MSRLYFTGSTAGLANKCPASAVLPRVGHSSPEADFGSAFHEHLALRATHGMEHAMEMLPELAAKWRLDERHTGFLHSTARSFPWAPPPGTVVEIALALLEDGSVVMCRGGRGQYDAPEGAIYAATLDAIWSEPEPLLNDRGLKAICPPGSLLWAVDWKTGSDVNCEPVESNRQALYNALVAAKWTGAELVMPALVYTRANAWDHAGQPLGVQQLQRIEADLRATWARCDAARRAVEAGLQPEMEEGPHCTWCASQSRCSAKTAMVKAALGDSLIPTGDSPLTTQQAQRLAGSLRLLKSCVERAEKVCQAHVQATGAPIDLGNGLLWGPNPHPTTVLDARKTVAALAEEIGADEAWAAMSTSKSAVEEAIKRAHETQGIKRQGAKAKRGVLDRLEAAGGLTKKTTTWWSAYRADAVETE